MHSRRHVRAELGGRERGRKIVWCAHEHSEGHPQGSAAFDCSRRGVRNRGDRRHRYRRSVRRCHDEGHGAGIER
eukprot:6046120-Pleurochrysis_carterae.AAC.1